MAVFVLVLVLVGMAEGGRHVLTARRSFAALPPETQAAIREAKATRRAYRQAQSAYDQRVKVATDQLANLESRNGRRLKSVGGVTLYERWIDTPQGSGPLIGVQAEATDDTTPQAKDKNSRGNAYVRIQGQGFAGTATIAAKNNAGAGRDAFAFAAEIVHAAAAAQAAEPGRPAAIEVARQALVAAQDHRDVDAAEAAYSEAVTALPEEHRAGMTDTSPGKFAGRAWRSFRQWPTWEQASAGVWAVLLVVVLGSAVARSGSGTAEDVSASVPTSTERPASTQPATTRAPQPSTTPTAPPPTTQRPAPSDPFPPKSPKDVGALGVAAPKLARDVRREMAGLPSCPELRIQAVLPVGLSDRDLTAALARIYVDERLDLGCGGVIFAYTDKSEYDDLFTVGRLIIDGSNRRRLGGTGTSPGHFEIDGGPAVPSHVIARFDF